MRRDSGATLLGIVLILAGLLFLLMNFGFLRNIGSLIIALLFAFGGLAFLFVFAANRDHWWALFPAFALLGISGVITISAIAPWLNGPWVGALFLASLSAAFWLVYFTHPENWWAVIPGGVLLTLAAVAGWAPLLGASSGGLFFLGLSATFGLVYLLPTPQGRMLWAAWPAGACLVMGLLLSFMLSGLLNFIFPAALILAGLFILLRYMRQREA